jgi:hypothetical protein
MKQLCSAWTSRILVATALTFAGAAYGQQAADPYQGVSQPPPDDTIVASPDAQPMAKPSPAKPLVEAAPAPAASYTEPAPTPAPRAASSGNNFNPDDDIVSSVPGQASSGDSTNDATLQTRNNPDAGIVSVIPSSGNELPEGTNVRVRLTDQLSTKDTTVGSPFRGEVTTAVFKDGRIIIPPGSVLKGRVVSVRQGHQHGDSA